MVCGCTSIETNLTDNQHHADEFRKKVACENDVIQLICNPYSRIAVYSASYGRTEHESLQCTQPQGVKEESRSTISRYYNTNACQTAK